MESETFVIKTPKGSIHVATEGEESKKEVALVTLHDIAQNHVNGFRSFFCFHQFKPVLDSFTVYHLNFPGQNEDAELLPEDYVYPTMDEVTDMVKEVLDFYDIKNCVCFGIGAGANVFIRLALKYPKYVECLIAINGVANACSWYDWAYEKLSSYYLKSKGMTQFSIDYLLYRCFGGKKNDCINNDLVAMVTEQLKLIKHPRNLGFFMESYAKRSPIVINRPVIGERSSGSLKCGVLLITGKFSPAVDDTVELSSNLDPKISTWMKIEAASSMVLEEHPTRVVNAIIFFLQGYGHLSKVVPPALPNQSLNKVSQDKHASDNAVIYSNSHTEQQEDAL